ncbi:MAG: Xaa-Pro aminopeptidase [Minicystis sp.]
MTQPAELSPTLAAVLETHAPAPAVPASATAEPATQPDAGVPPKSSHDAPPKALVDFMLQGWTPPTAGVPDPVEHHEAFARRRRALSDRFAGDTLIIPAGHLKVRSNDTHYAFRPSSDFYYLTGNREPDCVLVLEPRTEGGHKSILFVEPNPGRSDPAFFTDRVKGELWVGARLGVPESQARFAVDECRPIADLAAYVAALADRAARPSRAARGFSAAIDGVLAEHERDAELATTLAEMRLIKDEVEVGELRAVIDATKRGFEDVIQRLPKARSEREVEGVFNLRARVEGNDVGYGTIAASGHHACTLHYTRNDGALDPDDLLLLDAGVEGNSFYTADITRTLPISGRFTKAQRTIYRLVHKAQKAAFAMVKPGNDFMEPNRAAMRVLAEGLEQLGILKTTAEYALKEEHQFYKRYSLHNVSHMLGLDVHDCAKARQEAYKLGKLAPGMVLTVEPGLYFQKDDSTVPEEYRGIGVRIEDDSPGHRGRLREPLGPHPEPDRRGRSLDRPPLEEGQEALTSRSPAPHATSSARRARTSASTSAAST